MSPASVTTSSSKISQFGLYRTIDARTEEFLKLSKKRQIRQGCVCAAISTAITVSIVIVILLIYEYTIAVESSLVQRKGGAKLKINDTFVTNDTPVADRLDRAYLGFDQDYLEQMPLLVNALQENSYVDPSVESPINVNKKGRNLLPSSSTISPLQSLLRTSAIRRTSPRPFIFEYRSPTPSPFHKNFNSRSWIESYRNAQRLKNLEQVISYLEKTINAKFGDLYTLPSSAQIAFSGIYLQPTSDDAKKITTSPLPETFPQSSNKVQTLQKLDHQSDPYFSFKPESPGDVNLLADGPLKFAPVLTPTTVTKDFTKVPIFRPIPRLKGCIGVRCAFNNAEKKAFHVVQGSGEINSSLPVFTKPKSFSVIMNLFPVPATPPSFYKRQDILTTHPTPNKLYITTARPQYQFRRKSMSHRATYLMRKTRPPFIPKSKIAKNINNLQSTESRSDADSGAKMIFHVNVYPKNEVSSITTSTKAQATSTQSTTKSPHTDVMVNRPYVPTCPPICSSKVEDYHVGSSGVIPLELRTQPHTTTTSLPKVTTSLTFFDSGMTSSESWTTRPPEILKFSQEDAKIPEEYKKLRQSEEPNTKIESNRRTFRENLNEMYDVEKRTIIVKLKNHDESTTLMTTTEENMSEDITEEITEETTTFRTYVPQINGHYRSVILNSRHLNNWFDKNSEADRKKRLEITSLNSYKRAPSYIEIRRHKNEYLNKDEESAGETL